MATKRLQGVANRTPVLTSKTLNENFQLSGSFGFRDAYNLSKSTQKVLIFLSENHTHAQAVALAGACLGVRSTIVMPGDAPAVKRVATGEYGAEIISCVQNETIHEILAQQPAIRLFANLHMT